MTTAPDNQSDAELNPQPIPPAEQPQVATKPKRDHLFLTGVIATLVAAVGVPLLQSLSLFQLDNRAGGGTLDISVVLSGLLYAVLGSALAVLVGTAAHAKGSKGRRLLSLWLSTGVGIAVAVILGWFAGWFKVDEFNAHAISAIAALLGAAIVGSFYTGRKH